VVGYQLFPMAFFMSIWALFVYHALDYLAAFLMRAWWLRRVEVYLLNNTGSVYFLKNTADTTARIELILAKWAVKKGRLAWWELVRGGQHGLVLSHEYAASIVSVSERDADEDDEPMVSGGKRFN
jgi:hypothetical protein